MSAQGAAPQAEVGAQPDPASVPELRAARDFWMREFLDAARSATQNHYRPLMRLCDADDQLQTALWRQAVESHRWLRYDQREGHDGALWWWIWRRVLAMRWSLAERRECPAGFVPSKEIALRNRLTGEA